MASTKFELSLTESELEYLKTFVDRNILRLRREGAVDVTAIRLQDKLATTMQLNRVEIKILKRLCEDYVLVTKTTTLPEYDRRISQYPEAAAKYVPYIVKTEAELKAVQDILAKIKEHV